MVKSSMEIKGLKELMDALVKLPKEINKQKVVLRALHDGARPMVAEAKRLAPVLDETKTYTRVGAKGKQYKYRGTKYRKRGALRSAITQHTSRTEYNSVWVRVRSKSYIFGANKKGARVGDPNYWWLVEFGTSKMAARPFMRPAFETKKRESALLIRESLARGIEFCADQVKSKVK
jgi:HK97 gp10 family phage protein